jgi:hypothetical protein
MGWETANVHLGSASAKTLAADLSKRPDNWLHHDAERMAESVKDDWLDWRKEIDQRKEKDLPASSLVSRGAPETPETPNQRAGSSM